MSPIDPATVLRAYPGADQATVATTHEGTTGYSGAEIFQVSMDQRHFCLRRWPATGLTPTRIRGLHRLLQTVARVGGPPVPVPLINNVGSTLTQVAGYWWQLEPWMPGQADFRTNPNTERLVAAMHALAQWHHAATHFQPREQEITWFASYTAAPSPAVNERLTRLESYTSRVHSDLQHALQQSQRRALPETTQFCQLGHRVLNAAHNLAPSIHQQLSGLRETKFRLQPCLRDVWHDHVLFVDNRVSGLIDASACRFDHVATDISRLVGSLANNDTSDWDIALKAYQSQQPLTLDEQVLVWALDRSGTLLACLTWITRFVETGLPRERISAVSQRIGRMLARLEDWANNS